MLVDSGNTHTVSGVVRREVATAYHPNSERVDVFRRDHAHSGTESPFRIDGLAHNREPGAIAGATTGNTSCQSSLRYSREVLNFFQHLPVIRPDLIWSIEASIGYGQTKRQHVVCLNAEIDPVEIPETSQRQTSGRQQGERQRKLRDDERTEGVALQPTTAASSAQLQNFIEIDSCCLPGRRGSKQQSGHCRDSDRK